MAEGQSHDNFTGGKSFLVMPSYVMGDGFWDMTDKYGPYVDRIRPFFVRSLEGRIYSVLEEFVYAENSSLAEHLPRLRRCLDALTSWTVPLEEFCAKSKDESVAEETMRLAIKYVVKDGLIDGFVNSIVLNNRLNRICRELEGMGIELDFFPSHSKIDHDENHSANHENGKSAGGGTLEIARGPGDSDLEVEIGSGRVETSLESPSSRKRARKRAATYDSPSNANIDPREPAESPFRRESSQDRFRISEDLARRLSSAANLLPEIPRKPENRGKARRSRTTLSYDLRDSRNDWKNARLRLRIRRVIVAGGNCVCGGWRDDLVCRLTLPCKVDALKTRIFRADPTLVEPCLIVMRRKFVNGLRNVCSCLDDILSRIRRRRIEELCLCCEIRSGHIGFKLRARGGRKPVCLFAGRVPVCRNVRKQRVVIRETTSRDFTHLSSVSGKPGNNVDDSRKCNTEEKRLPLYSPCSNDSFPGSSKTRITKTDEKCQWFSAESNFSRTNKSANYSGMHVKGNSRSTGKIHYAISTDNSSSSTVDLPREMFEENKVDCKCLKSKQVPSVCNLTTCVKNEDPSTFREIFRKGNCFCQDDCESIELLSDLSAIDNEEDRFLSLRSSGTNLDEVMKYSKYPSLLSPGEKLRETKARCSCSKSASCGKLFEKKVHTSLPKNDSKVTISPFVNEKKDPEVVSGIREVLDLVLAEAKDRFLTLRKENGQLFSVSVQTKEHQSSSKAINVNLQRTNSNFNESDVKKYLETSTSETKKCKKYVDKLDIQERQIISRNMNFEEEKQTKVDKFVEKVEISENRQDFGSSVNEIFLKEALTEYPKTFVSVEIQSNVKEFVIHPNQFFTPQPDNLAKSASIQKFEKGSTANAVRERGTIAHDRQDFGSNFNGTSSAKIVPAIQKTFASSQTQSSVKELVRRSNKFSNFTSGSSVISEERAPSYRNRKLQVSTRTFARTRIYQDTRSRNSISLGSSDFDCPSRCEGRGKMYLRQNRCRLSSRMPRDRKCVCDGKNGGVKGRRSIHYCRGFPGNSIDRLRHLIRGKLSRVLLDNNKASGTSKTFLRNDKYLVSVFRAKVSRSPYASTISTSPTATKSHVDATESSGNSFPGHGTTMESRTKNYGNPQGPRLPGGSEGNPNDGNPKLAMSYATNSRSSNSFLMHRQRCNKLRNRYCCIKDFAMNRISDLKEETRTANYHGHRRVKNVSNVLTDLRDHNRVKMKGELNDTRKCNDRFDKKRYYPTFEHSCYYDKENYDCQSIFTKSFDSTRQNFQPLSKWYFHFSQGRENSMVPGKKVGGDFAEPYCDKRMNDLSVNFRTKLARYVELCKSVKSSILNKLRPDDIYEVSTTSIPSTYANKYNINTRQYYESNR